MRINRSSIKSHLLTSKPSMKEGLFFAGRMVLAGSLFGFFKEVPMGNNNRVNGRNGALPSRMDCLNTKTTPHGEVVETEAPTHFGLARPGERVHYGTHAVDHGGITLWEGDHDRRRSVSGGSCSNSNGASAGTTGEEQLNEPVTAEAPTGYRPDFELGEIAQQFEQAEAEDCTPRQADDWNSGDTMPESRQSSD